MIVDFYLILMMTVLNVISELVFPPSVVAQIKEQEHPENHLSHFSNAQQVLNQMLTISSENNGDLANSEKYKV